RIAVRGGVLLAADGERALVLAANVGDAPLVFAGVALAPGAIAPVAGSGLPLFGEDPAPALASGLGAPAGVAIAAGGVAVFAERDAGIVRLLNAGAAPVAASGRAILPGEVGIVAGAPGGGARIA